MRRRESMSKFNTFTADLQRRYKNGSLGEWFAIFWMLLPYALMFSLFVAIPVA